MARTSSTVPVRFNGQPSAPLLALQLMKAVERKERQINRLRIVARKQRQELRQQHESYAILAREIAEDAEFSYYANLANVSEWSSSPAGGPPHRAA